MRVKFIVSGLKVAGAYLVLAVVLAVIALVFMAVLGLSFDFDFVAMMLSIILLVISFIDLVRVIAQVPEFVKDGTFIGKKKSPASTAAAFTMSAFVMSAALTAVTWIRFVNGISGSS